MASYKESQKVIPNFKDSIELWIDIWSDRKKIKCWKNSKATRLYRGVCKRKFIGETRTYWSDGEETM